MHRWAVLADRADPALALDEIGQAFLRKAVLALESTQALAIRLAWLAPAATTARLIWRPREVVDRLDGLARGAVKMTVRDIYSFANRLARPSLPPAIGRGRTNGETRSTVERTAIGIDPIESELMDVLVQPTVGTLFQDHSPPFCT
jgi:hypothetical protein